MISACTKYIQNIQNIYIDEKQKINSDNNIKYCLTNAGNEGITGHYNRVALASLPANTSVFDTAHFFALFNVAQFDGRIAYFTMKYNNLYWRPITAASQLIRYIQLQRWSKVQMCLCA